MEINLSRVLDGLPAMVWTALPDGHIDFVNRRWCEYTGLDLDAARSSEWHASVLPEDKPRLLERWRSILASGEPGEVEARIRRSDGQHRWFLVQCNPIRDDAGRIVKWCGLSTDVEDLRRAERDLRLTIDTIPAFVVAYEPDGSRSFVNRIWQDYMGLTPGQVTGPGATTFPYFHPDDVERNDKAWRASLASGEPLSIEARVRRADGQYRWHTMRRVPLRDEEGNIVRWYAVGLDIEDQKRAEEALLASEREARLIVDSIPGGIEILTPGGEIEAVNEHVAKYFGRTVEELKRTGLTGLIHPEDLQNVLDTALHSTSTGEPYDAEQRFLGADGKYRWFHVRGLPLRDANGRIARWYALHIDIDERKRAEEALAASERNLKLIVDTIHALAWSARPDGTAEFFNQHYLDYVGLSAEQAAGWGWTAAVHPDDLDGLAATWQTILASGKLGEAEARLRRNDGEYRWFLFRANPSRDESGNIVKWYGVNTDIEERKRAEEALGVSERYSRLIVDSIPGLVAVFAPSGEVEAVNHQVLEYFGTTEEEQRRWATGNVVHPEDLPRAIEFFSRSLASGDPFDFEVRARRFDGVYRWFQSRGFPLQDTNGRIVRWYNLLIDIEDRKRAEEAVAASERNLKLIIDTIPALAWSAGTDGSADFFNQHYLNYVGLSAEQAQGWGWAVAVHPDDLNGLAAIWQAALASQTSGEAEARMRRFDGEYRWFLFRVDPLRDETGTIVKWYGINTDIEDRKRAEDELRRSEAFLADAQRLSRTGSFLWRIGTEELEWSDETYRIYELDPAVPVTFDLVRTRVHPDNLAALQEVMDQARRDGGDFDYETRLLMPDQSVKYLRVVAHGDRNKDGQLELRGAVQDDHGAPALGGGARQAQVGACARHQGDKPWGNDGVDRARSQPAAVGHHHQRQHVPSDAGCGSAKRRGRARDRATYHPRRQPCG